MSIILRDFNIHVGNKDDPPMLISAGGGASGNKQNNDDDNGMTCQLLCTAISVLVKTKKANNAGNKQPGDDASKSTLSSSQFCFILAAPQSIPACIA